MTLTTKIGIGLVAGAILGVAANWAAADATWLAWLNRNVMDPAGRIFLRLLLMVVVPLVFASLSLGVAGLGDIRRVGRIGAKTMGYFLASTAAAGALGLLLVNVVRPGAGIPAAVRDGLMSTFASDAASRVAAAETTTFGIQTLVGIVPRNPVQAAADFDMLGVIFFSMVFGAALTVIPREKADPMLRVLDALNDVVIKIIDFAMRLAPYGVFALIFVVTSRFGWGLLRQLGLYVGVVLAGLALHAGVTLAAVVRFGAGLSPLRFLRAIEEAVLTAFSTSSSSATLPTSLRVAERNLGVPPQVAGFVLPLGATLNMNGTAVFEGVTVLFIAQVFGVSLSLPAQVVVLALTVLTAVGAAGVPSGAIPLIVIVLQSVGVPGEGIAIVLGVDRLLDMCRTTVNISGDLVAATVVGRAEGVWSPAMVGAPRLADAAD